MNFRPPLRYFTGIFSSQLLYTLFYSFVLFTSFYALLFTFFFFILHLVLYLNNFLALIFQDSRIWVVYSCEMHVLQKRHVKGAILETSNFRLAFAKLYVCILFIFVYKYIWYDGLNLIYLFSGHVLNVSSRQQ